MFEVVTVSALTAFLTAVGNGAAGEMGKQMLLSTGALVRRTLGRETPLPATPEGWEVLAREMHARLSGDPRRGGEWAILLRTLQDDDVALVPGAGLPPATRDFTDRQAVLRRLKREATRAAAGRPRVALLYGPPGIGTSAVALHWGAEQIAQYPDGQFYVDLRDAAGESGLEPSAVVLRLLGQMGVEPEGIPPAESARVGLYRRLLAGRRALVVIDHASSAAQVRALVPATPDVFLLVVASGPALALEAERIEVPPLSDRDAVKMLRKVAGPEKVALAKPRMPSLLGHCAGNAFALKAAAMSLLAEEPPLPEDVAESTARHPVHGMVRSACRRLRPETARLCRLTALGGWPAIDARLAGDTAAVGQEEAAGMLAEAADAQLVEALGDGRYRFRPEVRRVLADTAALEHGIPECSAAMSRALDGLLNRALHAAHAALPQSWRTEPAPAQGTAYRDEAEGMAALLAETGNVVRAVSVAEEYQHIDTAMRMARALWPVQLKAGFWDEVLPALRIAARCADRHHADSRMAGALHFQLGHCLGELRLWNEADRAVHTAAACERAAGHLRGEASSVEMLGLLKLNDWRYDAAYERFVEAERIYRRIAPGQEGAEDLPRALALAERHQGRALRGLGRLEESRVLLETARDFFAERGEAYNQARALTDLAETLHDAGDHAGALTKIAEAERLLNPEKATPHLNHLARLRLSCQTPR
ncbi:ATP-binding protein [Streptomyces antimycoticus]|uniref:ATP-binding protein n=1 Tax=Streptomyces mordarskii TaxID=1226758 RepID=A0ABP3MY42_9ACTN|nr:MULTISPECIES: ATP-binding protein [Streptomyces]RSS47887.1 ATP-binding protein [Streptomyces sp. WAC05858]WJE01752.1 ATP-binding protein [Streptomyces antimycoticus]WTA78864.1 ATP-binding protein [Streptomyces antimycoticus]